MSKLKPAQSAFIPKEKSWGPYFRVIRKSDNRVEGHPWCIASVDEPTKEEIRLTADSTVRRMNIAYRTEHYWERVPGDTPARDGVLGTPARLEAMRRVHGVFDNRATAAGGVVGYPGAKRRT